VVWEIQHIFAARSIGKKGDEDYIFRERGMANKRHRERGGGLAAQKIRARQEACIAVKNLPSVSLFQRKRKAVTNALRGEGDERSRTWRKHPLEEARI
jgi:hypothetical protein